MEGEHPETCWAGMFVGKLQFKKWAFHAAAGMLMKNQTKAESPETYS